MGQNWSKTLLKCKNSNSYQTLKDIFYSYIAIMTLTNLVCRLCMNILTIFGKFFRNPEIFLQPWVASFSMSVVMLELRY